MKGYFAGYRKATLDHLDNKCIKCGATENLEIDHIKPINCKNRNLKHYSDLSKLQILCKDCNKKKGNHYCPK